MKLLNNHKGKLITSSILILLPMLLGLFTRLLPEKIAVHWGIDGAANGWMSTTLIFFVLPAILLAIHWLCMILSAVIDKNAEENNKMFGMMFWIIPVISLASCGSIFAIALGATSIISCAVLLIIGISFLLIGNYMPKTTQNLTMGIKIRWTLANEENWNATHRFAGKVYFVVGLLCLVAIPLPTAVLPFVLIAIILVAVLLPLIYSYRFYKKQIREGRATKEEYEKKLGEIVKKNKVAVTVSVIMISLVLIFVLILMFTGRVEATADDTALSVRATYWEDLTLSYDEIDTVEYREDGVDGRRIAGYGSARLLLGSFENEEFGAYTRYTYGGEKPCIVITVDEAVFVIGAEDEQSTKELYEKIVEKIAE